jgi:hypothetical protein
MKFSAMSKFPAQMRFSGTSGSPRQSTFASNIRQSPLLKRPRLNNPATVLAGGALVMTVLASWRKLPAVARILAGLSAVVWGSWAIGSVFRNRTKLNTHQGLVDMETAYTQNLPPEAERILGEIAQIESDIARTRLSGKDEEKAPVADVEEKRARFLAQLRTDLAKRQAELAHVLNSTRDKR